jgi:hypothetical protein
MGNRRWDLSKCKNDAANHTSRIEWKRNNPSAYATACQNGWLEECCSHMSRLISPRGFWTKNRCKEEALKFSSRVDWQKNSSSSYVISWNNGWLEECCGHMKLLQLPNGYWDITKCKEEALKFDTRSKWENGSASSYTLSCQNGWLEECCGHMKISTGSSSFENDLFNNIEFVYSTAKMLRDKKVQVYGKPHIQGFDIDIYVPELKKGIEFDGKYWHSVSGLKRSRIDWPQQDLINYHKIKDDYFRSKGIEILHINEVDWIKDKETCVKKCFNFLGNV